MTKHYANIRTIHPDSGASQAGPFDRKHAVESVQEKLAGLLAKTNVDVIIKPAGVIEGPDHVRAEYEKALAEAQEQLADFRAIVCCATGVSPEVSDFELGYRLGVLRP